MDKFDLKKYLTEGKILKKEISENEEYKPFVKGKTFLIKEELVKVTKTYAFEIENEEEYNFLLNEGPFDYFTKHKLWGEEEKYFVDEERVGSELKEEYFIEDRSGDTTPIDEPQIKEDRRYIPTYYTKYPEFDEDDDVYVEKREYVEKYDVYLAPVNSKEEYDTLTKYGGGDFDGQHDPDWEFDESREQYIDSDLTSYTLHADGEEFNIKN